MRREYNYGINNSNSETFVSQVQVCLSRKKLSHRRAVDLNENGYGTRDDTDES